MPNNLTGQNISDTYRRLLQIQGGVLTDGTGSIITVPSASYAISASHEITYELSSSHAETADALTGLTTTVAELNHLDGITDTQGDYVMAMNQSVAQGSTVTFGPLEATVASATVKFKHDYASPGPGKPTMANSAENVGFFIGSAPISEQIFGWTVNGELKCSINPLGVFVGNVAGNASGTALTVTQAAQTAITSVGTLTGLNTSGNISSSGNNVANAFYSDDQYRINDSGGTSRHAIRRTATNTLELGNTNFDEGLLLTGNVTASGNISASGHITASSIWLPGGNTITWANDQAISGNNNNIIIDGDEIIKLRADSTIEFQDVSNVAQVTVNPIAGNITASNNISASGIIYAARVYPNGPIGPFIDQSQTGNDIGSSTGFYASTNITASGNISASGTIYAEGFDAAEGNITNVGILRTDIIRSNTSTAVGLTIVPNITASGDISASATVTARNFEYPTTNNTTVGSSTGDIITWGTATATTAGQIYYYNTSGAWTVADADALSSSKSLLGVATDDNSSKGMLLRGVTTLHTITGTQDEGAPIYLKPSADGHGNIDTPATSGHIVRIIGYCLNTDKLAWFDPDKTWVELS